MQENRRKAPGAQDTGAAPKRSLEASLELSSGEALDAQLPQHNLCTNSRCRGRCCKCRGERMIVVVVAATAAMADRRCLREHLTAAKRETATSPCCGQHAKIKHGFACACACVCEPRRGTQTPTWAAWDPGQRSKGWHPWTQSGSSRTCLGDPGPGPGAPNPVSEAGPELIVFFSFYL